MDPDVALTLGLFFGVLALPSLLSAILDRRLPTVSVVLAIVAAGLLAYAYDARGGYGLSDIPNAFYSGIAAMRDALF